MNRIIFMCFLLLACSDIDNPVLPLTENNNNVITVAANDRKLVPYKIDLENPPIVAVYLFSYPLGDMGEPHLVPRTNFSLSEEGILLVNGANFERRFVIRILE